MKNSAALLADLFASWDVAQGQTVTAARKASMPGVSSLWNVQRLAITYLLEVERDLVAMEAAGDVVDHYRETLPAWYETVHSWNFSWQTAANGPVPAIDGRDLRLLYALAGQVDSLKLVPKLEVDQLSSLRANLNEAQSLIAAATPPTLDDSARRYLLGLVLEANRCLDEIELLGTATLRRVTFELGGGMVSVAEEATDANVERTWREKAKGVLVTWATLIPATAITTGVAEGIKAIGS